ncbi:fungal specific transcription factor domain-containing protein [Phlyctema vagabunda]|uniref:Fungal specific transcription factor domain-containing protein n=1 Tax=Phlyctema vagabunda TaxID=108571 RepID=A0ABR4P9B3_9HELO
MSVDPKYHPWDVIWGLWVEAASIHGWIYEKLYSPRGLNQSAEERMAVVKHLSEYTMGAQRKNAELKASSETAVRPEYIKFVLEGDEVVYWSLLTLIYRAAPKDPQESSPFNKDCINAARSALAAHQSCALKYRDDHEYMWTIYLHWTLLSCPFIPFLVVFCHAVTFLDEADMTRLEQFVLSLQPTKRASEAGIKMYRLCSMFHRVGKLYMDGRLRDRRDQQLRTQAWDPYMNALKIVPGLSQLDEWNTSSMDLNTNSMNGVELQNDPAALGDWFEGNQFIFGLLESDLSGLDFPGTGSGM